MKKILITIVFILILIIPAYASEAPGYVVDLSTKGGYEAYVELVDLDKYPVGITNGSEFTTHGMYIEYKDANGKGLGEYRWTVDYTFNEEDKCITFVGKPEELKTSQKDDLRLTIQTEFSPKELPYVVICYRITDKAPISTNHIYLRDNRKNKEYSGVQYTWTPHQLVANGQWNYRILDMQKELSAITGKCMGIRLPICTQEGDKFDVKFVAAFATKEAAENFDIEAFETYLASITTPEPTEDNTKTPGPYEGGKSSLGVWGTVLFVAVAIIVVVGVTALYRFLAKKL